MRHVSRETDPELFWATAGGLGRTGLILRVALRMTHVESAHYVVDTERARDLDELMLRLEEDDHRYTHSVTSIDCPARGSARAVRASREAAPHASRTRRGARQRAPLEFRPKAALTVPDVFPSGLLNTLTVTAFNQMWFRKAPRRAQRDVQSLSQFFHPLDMVRDWNRVYGPRGFLQYQFVVPFGAELALRRVVQRLSEAGAASFLAVLKRFGKRKPRTALVSLAGWTLAWTFRSPLGTLLNELDTTVLDAGGRLYLAKESRAAAATISAMYPSVQAFRAVRDRVDPDRRFNSDLARRLDL